MSSGGSPHNVDVEEFTFFFQTWIAEQDRLLHQLLDASSNAEDPQELRSLVNQVIGHYEHYYKAKSTSARRDVLPMFTPKWTSSTENLFQWVGGWQPSAAFQLFYSKQGHQLLSRLDDILDGVHMGDLADLSPEQLVRVDALQRRVIHSEREITEEAAVVQSTIANSSVVDLSHVITEMKREGRNGETAAQEEEMGSEMGEKKEGMVTVLKKADGLRLETVKGIVEILEPLQAVHFLISAAEVHLRVHEWGMKKDHAASAASTAAASSTSSASTSTTPNRRS